MRLLVNVSSIGERSTGMGVYATHCARALNAAFDCDFAAPESIDAYDHVVLRAPMSHALGAGRTAALKRWVWSKRQRSFPDHVLYTPTHHSLRKAHADPLQYLYFSQQLPKELARCAAVFTVSETSRQDIHDHYGYPLDRIRVVTNGVDRNVFQLAPHKTRLPFLLIVGASWPHKNVEELLINARLCRG